MIKKNYSSIRELIIVGCLGFLLIISGGGTFAYESPDQAFDFQAELPEVDSAGFYKIPLLPRVSKHLRGGLRDLRLFNGKGAEVPYLLETAASKAPEKRFKEYSIINKRHGQSATYITFENPQQNQIDNLSIQLKNASVSKTAALSGSNEKDQWYAIEKAFQLQKLYSDTGATEVKVLDFPQTDYPYYRLKIHDTASNPINILKVGYYDRQAQERQYFALPDPELEQNNTPNNKTFLKVKLPASYHIDRLSFDVSDPVYFHRKARIKVPEENRTLKSFVLSSKHTNQVTFPTVKTDIVVVIIENKDNPPLAIEKVEAGQLKRHVMAYLKPNGAYRLRFGSDEMANPQYELRHFKDSIPPDPGILNPGPIQGTKKGQKKDTSSGLIFESRIWIWVTLGVVMLILGFLSFQMINRMK